MRQTLFHLVVLAALWPPAAIGHGAAPEPTSLRARPGSMDLLLGTTFGVVRREGQQGPWEVICAEGIGYDERFAPVVHWSADGTLLVGAPNGLFVSHDQGCNFEPVPELLASGVTDVQPGPGALRVVYATTGRFGAANGVFRSDDGGDSFPTAVLTRPNTLYSAVRFAPADPGRLWVSAWYGAPAEALLFRSDDGGQSFTELPAAVGDAASSFTLLAVHPTHKDTLLVGASETNEHVLLLTVDGGITYAEVARDALAFGSAAFSPDGSAAWAAAGRLFGSQDHGATFVPFPSPARARCASWVEGGAHACGSPVLDGWAVARVDGPSGPQEVLNFADLRLRQCPAGSQVQEQCAPLWPLLAQALGAKVDPEEECCEAQPDGGPAVPQPAQGCGCHPGAGGGALVWLLPVGLWLAGRRRGRVVAALLLATALAGCPGPVSPADAGCEGPACAVDPCAAIRCEEEGRSLCVVEEGVAHCACDLGRVDTGGQCLLADPCRPNPCKAPNKGVCTPIGSGAVCSCDADYEPNGPHCLPIIPQGCDGVQQEGDPFEPDGCQELAREIGLSGEQEEPHTFDPEGDEDWFKAEVSPGQIIHLQAGGELGLTFRAAAYFSEQLEPLGTPRGPAPLLDFALKAPGAGTVYLRLRAGTFEQQGAYLVSLGELGFDDHVDLAEEAPPAALGEVHQGSIQFEGDVDVLGFFFEQGHSHRVRTTWSADAGPLAVSLLAGTPPGLRRAEEGPGPVLTTRASSAGMHAVALAAADGRRGGRWTLEVEDLGPDDHGDHPSEATYLPLGLTSTGQLERLGDEDAFAFDASAGRIYRFTCTPLGMADCQVTLLGPQGTVLAQDLSGGQGVLLRKYPVGGRYTAVVHAPAGTSGSYRYLLEDLGVDDHGDDPSSATPLGMPVGEVGGMGQFETPGDRDFLRFDADPEHIYRISCTPSWGGDCQVRVYNSFGAVVAQDTDGGGALLLHLFDPGGDHFVELFPGGDQVGEYQWSITDLNHDDHGDLPHLATLMSANAAAVAGEIQTPLDKDWFRFVATAGSAYRVSCQRQSLPDCLVRLTDQTQSVLAQDLSGQDALILWTAPSNATYSFEVRGAPGQLGTYQVKIEPGP